MVFGFGKSVKHREISPAALNALIETGEVLVIDVREADEFVAGHIPGAINLPLSAFQVGQLPPPNGKTLVLNCLGGKRSAQALDRCALARIAVDTHLAGGFGAWKSAGLPVAR